MARNAANNECPMSVALRKKLVGSGEPHRSVGSIGLWDKGMYFLSMYLVPQ